MKKAYNRTIWENYPSDASPIAEDRHAAPFLVICKCLLQ